MSEKKKDYLSMLAYEVDEKKKKPASFSEEKIERIEKPKVNLNLKWIVAGCVLLFALCAGAYVLFFAPKIEMPDFVGQKTSDVTAWVKQQGIAASGIIIKEEYSFDDLVSSSGHPLRFDFAVFDDDGDIDFLI